MGQYTSILFGKPHGFNSQGSLGFATQFVHFNCTRLKKQLFQFNQKFKHMFCHGFFHIFAPHSTYPLVNCYVAIGNGHLVRWFTYSKRWFSLIFHIPEGNLQFIPVAMAPRARARPAFLGFSGAPGPSADSPWPPRGCAKRGRGPGRPRAATRCRRGSGRNRHPPHRLKRLERKPPGNDVKDGEI